MNKYFINVYSKRDKLDINNWIIHINISNINKILKNKAMNNKIIKIAPINLFGIIRRIEWIKRKYHSGIILSGVINELAIIKLSQLPKLSGSINK